jgi:hypothetical protein
MRSSATGENDGGSDASGRSIAAIGHTYSDKLRRRELAPGSRRVEGAARRGQGRRENPEPRKLRKTRGFGVGHGPFVWVRPRDFLNLRSSLRYVGRYRFSAVLHILAIKLITASSDLKVFSLEKVEALSISLSPTRRSNPTSSRIYAKNLCTVGVRDT